MTDDGAPDETLELERTETVDSKRTVDRELDQPDDLESDRLIDLESDAAGGSEPPGPAGIDRTGPLSDLAAAADRRRDATGDDADAGADLGELFDREDVADIDRDRLWERLEDDDDESAAPPRSEEREIREIETDGYCHQCEHFASPPTVACTREGTDILDVPALDRFRVADCPVVLEDEALENQ